MRRSACSEARGRTSPRRSAHWQAPPPLPPLPRASLVAMRVATWNVNSVKQRVPRLLAWLDQRQPDVVCLQETKLADSAFLDLLGGQLDRRGYAIALHGQAQWN